ncbi:MAG: hypothetical protein KF911_15655 [Pseudomonadales bacterium]|nr:hypothetical protein [Pseudomonadales bacterium]
MTLENIYYVGQTIAVGAILATLGAVYWQVRQNNQIARATLTQSTWLQSTQMHAALYDTPEKAELMHRALFATGPLSDVERLRIGTCIAVALGTHEAAFNLRRRGMIEEAAYRSCEEVTRRYLLSPIVRRWWARNRDSGRDAAFVALLDGFVAKIDAAAPGRSTPVTPAS